LRPHSSITDNDLDPKPSTFELSGSLPDNVDEEGNGDDEGRRTAKSHCKLVGILPGMTNYEDSRFIYFPFSLLKKLLKFGNKLNKSKIFK